MRIFRALGWTGLAAGAVLALVSCDDGPFSESMLEPDGGDPNTTVVGTVLSGSDTVNTGWLRQTTYDWTLEKTVDPSRLTLSAGQTGTFGFSITAARGAPEVVESYAVSGEICLFNSSSTTPVTIASMEDQVWFYFGPDMTLLAEAEVDFSGSPVVDPRTQDCYDYSVTMPEDFAPVRSPDEVGRVPVYWNRVIVGYHLGEGLLQDYVFQREFTWAESFVETTIDATAHLDDAVTCPAGISCVPLSAAWDLSGTEVLTLDVAVTNESAECGTTADMVNDAALAEDDTGESRSASATATIDVPECLRMGCGACDGKVTALTLRYNGPTAAEVQVVQKKEDVTLFAGMVQPGDDFSFFGADKKGTMSTEIRIYVNGELNAKIHTSCSQPIGPGLVRGDFEVVSGESRNGGPLCPLPPQPTCGECKGKVTALTLLNDGPAGQVRVEQKKDHVTLFDGWVDSGEEFSFVGADKKGTMSSEISIYVNGELNAKIHTSCSQPIGPGLIRGNFEVVSGRSREGGSLCPLIAPPMDANFCTEGVKPHALTMEYTGDGCDATSNSQESSEVACEGDPQDADPVRIIASDKEQPFHHKAHVWYDGSVGLDGSFVLDAHDGGADRLKGNTWIHILGSEDQALQTVRFHTSCSQPLYAGDQFGSLLLTALDPAP